NALLDAGCTPIAAVARPGELLFVVDGSGSMEGAKWTAAVGALDAFFDAIYAATDTSVRVGLLVFADTLDPTTGNGPYPSSIDVAPAIVDSAQHTALRARLDPADAGGGTPMYLALSGAYASLEAFDAGAGAPASPEKVVLLLTDGVPNAGD